MDDYAQDVLTSARDEYQAQLITHMERSIMPWLDEVFAETVSLCQLNRQPHLYLQSMQTTMEAVKDWNSVALEKEIARVRQRCAYIADLLAHAVVVQVKLLSCGRTTDRRKNIRVETPPLAQFVHRTYINVARQMFVHPFLFETLTSDLERTRQRAERERLVRGCILDTIRNGLGVPTEAIMRAFMDEAVENEEQVFIEPVAPPERDQVQELESAKRRALGLEPMVVDTATGAGSDVDAAVTSMRRGPEPMDATAEISGAVTNADDAPVVSRVEFNPHRDQVFSIPPRERSEYAAMEEEEEEDRSRPSSPAAELESIDDLF
jgi:hypothetical protein